MVAESARPGNGASAEVLAAIFASTRAGLAVLRGRELIVEAANDAFAALAPEGAALVGQPATAVFPELAAQLGPVLLRVLDSGEPASVPDLPVQPLGYGRAGRYATVCARRIVGEDGAARLWLALVDSTSEVRARRRADLLAAFSTGLNSHPEMAVVVRRILRRAVALLGGWRGALWLLDEDGRTLRAAFGTPLREVRDTPFDLQTLPTAQRVLRARVAVFVTRAELAGAEPELFRRLDISAGVIAPLVAGDRGLGLLTMSFRAAEHRVEEDDLLFATALAAQGALAIQRTRALDEARRADAAVEASRARVRLLADVGRILASALEWEDAIQATARLAVGRLADWAIVDIVGEDGALRREAVRCATRSLEAPRWAPDERASGPRDAALGDALDRKLAGPRDLSSVEATNASPHLASLRAAGAASAIVAPLVFRGEALGVLTLARAASVAAYDADDVSVAEDLARRVALALHDARLLRSAERSIEMQHELLAMARHELRTPLTALTLQVGQLARATPEDARITTRVQSLERTTRRLTRTVDRLLDVAHIASGALALHRVPLDLAQVAAEAALRATPELERMGCTLHLVAPANLPARGDRLRIGGLVHHLLEHAARVGSGRPIDLVLSSRPGRSVLEVRYRGSPVSPELRDLLRAPVARHKPRANLADVELGLWIARWIAEAHGGRLLVRPSSDGAALVAELPDDGSSAAT